MIREDSEIKLSAIIENETIDELCNIIKRYNRLGEEQLQRIVADFCGVSIEDMMGDVRHLQNSQARWLYWYAYRYMTNDSYVAIAERNAHRKFTPQCVCSSISKMTDFISANTIWTKRWTVIKHIIKGILSNRPKQKEFICEDITIKVTAPRGVNVEVKQEQL